MKQLLSIARINGTQIKSILRKHEVNELFNLSDPCYLPRHRQYYLDLLHACGLNEKNIQDLVDRTWQGRKERNWRTVSDPIRLFFVWLMRYFLNQGDLQTFKLVIISHMLRQYSNLRRKHLTYCDPGVFQYTLENLSKTHLFVRENNITGAIRYLSNELAKKYGKKIKKWELDGIKDFIIESRGRLNQSLESFKKSYIKNAETKKEHATYKNDGEEEGEQVGVDILDRDNRLISDVTNQICQYGHIDQPAVKMWSRFTKVSKAMAAGLVNELSNRNSAREYFDDVKFILELFIRNSSSINEACGAGYLKNIAKLMQVKKTKRPVFFKKEVKDLLSKLIKNAGYEKKFANLTNQTQSRVSQFLAYYLTSVMRNLLFPKEKK